MPIYSLGMVPKGKSEYSSGSKTPLGKLDRGLGAVKVHSSSQGISLVGRGYQGEFPEDGYGLSGYLFQKRFKLPADVPANGILFFKYVYGSGSDGCETLNGKLYYKVHFNQLCKLDFRDVRVGRAGVAYPYSWIQRSEGGSALCAVKVSEALSAGAYVYLYCGNMLASDEAVDVFTAKVDGVVAAYPLDEEDREVDPTVVIDDNQAAFWTATGYGTGTYKFTISNDTTQKQSGTDCLKIKSSSDGTYANLKITKAFGTNQDWSAKSRVTFLFYGANTGKTFNLYIQTTLGYTDYFRYDFVDNFNGWQKITVPFSSFRSVGSPSWATVRQIEIYLQSTQMIIGTWYLDRIVLDSGVPAVDYSGNGNHGTATGTTIQTTGAKWVGKPGRVFNGLGDRIQLGNFAYDFSGNNPITVFANLRPFTQNKDWPVWFDLQRTTPTRDGYVFMAARYPNEQVRFSRYYNGVSVPNSVNISFDGSWYSVICSYDGVNTKLLLDALPELSVEDTRELPSFTKNPTIGNTQDMGSGYNGWISDLIIFSTVLSDSQKTALASGYPDPRLEQGKLYVYTYTPHPEPATDAFSDWRGRRSTGVQALYPSQGDCTATVDWASRCLTISDFWIRNDLAESPDAIVVSDANPSAAWSTYHSGTGSAPQLTLTELPGDGRFKITAATGSYADCGLERVYGSNQNWSNMYFICLSIVGRNSGETVTFSLECPDAANKYSTTITDNWVGLRRLVLPIYTLTKTGSPSLSAVRALRFSFASVSAGSEWLFGQRVTVDPGNWATLQVNISDVLQQLGAELNPDKDNMNVMLWNPNTSSYLAVTWWDAANWVFDGSNAYQLDNTTFASTYTGTYGTNYGVQFTKGRSKEQKGRQAGLMANRTIIYEASETRYKKGFAIRMKPNAYDYSASTGGNQVRCQIRIYYK